MTYHGGHIVLPLIHYQYQHRGSSFCHRTKNFTSPMASKLSHAHSSPCPTCGSPTRMIHRTNSTEGYAVNGQFSRLPPTKSIQEQLDNEVAKYSEPWLGSIPFKCRVVFGERGDPISHTPLQDIDICNYLNGSVFKAQRLYFCSSTYPRPPGRGQVNEADSWKKLKLDLGNASHSAGSPIVSNGGGASQRSFKCQVVHRARESFATKTDENIKHRCTSLINDALPNLGGKIGLTQPRKRKIAFEGTSCKFNFDIKWDEYGYYVNLNRDAGNPMHNNHPKPVDPSVIPYSSRLLAEETKKEIQNVVAASRSHSVARNYTLKNSKRNFLMQARWHTSVGKRRQGKVIKLMKSLRC